MSSRPARRLTGRHVLIVALAAFGTVVAANLTMLFAATGSFPGLVVGSSYVAGQGWDARAAAQEALGWTAETGWRGGRLVVALRGEDGRTVGDAALEATVGRPSSAAEDRRLPLSFERGVYTAPAPLPGGAWRVEIRTVAGPPFTVTDRLFLPEGR